MATVAEILGDVRGRRTCVILTRTPVRMRKTGNPFAGRVFTVAEREVEINFYLANDVRAALKRKGIDPDTYVAGTSWHEAVKRENGSLTCFRRHKRTGELYLWVRPVTSYSKHFELDDGSRIEEERFAQFVQRDETPFARQGLGEDYCAAYTIRLENVRAIHFKGEEVDILDSTEGSAAPHVAEMAH